MSATSRVGPFAGLRVLELGSMYAGPWVGRLFADYGAEVIKVEQPGVGDACRAWPPIKNGTSLPFLRVNRGKKSIAVDLNNLRGQQLVRQIAGHADVVTANLRPDTLKHWGLDYPALQAVNAAVVYVGISGYGKSGPYGGRPGFGSTADAISGFAHIVGYPSMPPSLAHFGLADFVAGTAGALGAAMALFRRELSGQGEEVDVALYEPLMTLVGDIVVDYSSLGVIRERRGNSVGIASPVGTFLTKDDKWIVISGSSDKMTHLLFVAMGREDLAGDPRFATNAARLQHEEEITSLIQSWVGTLERGQVLELLQNQGVVSGPVNTAEDIVNDPHFRHRTLVTGKSDLIGDVVVPGQMVHLASTPQVRYEDPPLIGEHTMEVLQELIGMSSSEMAELRASGVIA